MLFTGNAFAQQGTVNGRVVSAGQPVPFATVSIDQLGAQSNDAGYFTIANVPYGNHILKIESVEHKTEERKISIDKPVTELGELKIELVEILDEFTVTAKSKAQLVKEQPFAVDAIDMKPLQNLNMNVNQVLNQSTGVRIRETGGLGSDFVFSLSGFTGNQVRFFVDGLPTNALGSAYSINAIPVNNVERVEIYKGVVPVHLGADALGGAVNIVTNNSVRNFLDVSYGFGSFNTHQGSVVGRYSTKSGFVVNASAFYNYSDNNFKVDVRLVDKTTGKIADETTALPRFNDGFESATGMVEFGFVKKKFADRLLIGFIGSNTYKEFQNGADMTKPAGQVHRTETGVIPTLKYQKDHLFVKNLSLKISAVYSRIKSVNVDTSSRVYDWLGNYTYKPLDASSGELSWSKTMFTFNDESAMGTATLNYDLGKQHSFTLNHTYSYIDRQGTDPLSPYPIPYADPNILRKHFTGLSYQLRLFDDRWRTSVFGKAFNMTSILYRESDDVAIEAPTRTDNHYDLPAYGIASSFFIFPSLQVKASFEDTYRLPESYEIFGDGLLLLPNADLEPEKSKNFNVGGLFGKRFGKHLLNTEFNFMYRLPENLIRTVAIGILSKNENLSSAQITCYEAAIGYGFKNWLKVELNATYQNILNTSLLPNGEPDPLYLDRLPNTPYLFGNASVTLTSKEFGKMKQKLSFNWNTSYVEEFYLKWPSQGSKETKYVIPRQIVQNAAVTFTSHEGRYNVSLSCMNILDAKLYDNFRIQKPGRSFSIKLRYFLGN